MVADNLNGFALEDEEGNPIFEADEDVFEEEETIPAIDGDDNM